MHFTNPFTLTGATIWLGALCTLAIFSFLFKENRAYRFAEHILLGLGIGFGLAATIVEFLIPKWWVPLHDSWRSHNWAGVALGLSVFALGMMWYGMYHKKTVWLSRLVMGMSMGAGAGLAFKAEINDKLPQLIASFKSPYVPPSEVTFKDNSANNIIFIIILLSVLSYFFFSVEHKNRLLQNSSKAGRVFLMITFGIFFGNTIMTRMSVFIERIWFLLTKWMGIGT